VRTVGKLVSLRHGSNAFRLEGLNGCNGPLAAGTVQIA
jgi:hypothetical protein